MRPWHGAGAEGLGEVETREGLLDGRGDPDVIPWAQNLYRGSLDSSWLPFTYQVDIPFTVGTRSPTPSSTPTPPDHPADPDRPRQQDDDNNSRKNGTTIQILTRKTFMNQKQRRYTQAPTSCCSSQVRATAAWMGRQVLEVFHTASPVRPCSKQGLIKDTEKCPYQLKPTARMLQALCIVRSAQADCKEIVQGFCIV
eukprot:g4356.t1